MSFSDKIISYFPAAQKEGISLFEKKYKLEFLEVINIFIQDKWIINDGRYYFRNS